MANSIDIDQRQGFHCSGLRSPLSPLHCFITNVVIICVSLSCFKDEVKEHYADRTFVWNLERHQTKG